ncbi:MAG TPA: hypothetical protein VG013_29005 [Gemmataceae bacterium]|jgi:dipeptidyl aminopeptidase/acylaminoacyl peptidase|nr:hypothetical protein [Gemmataceae bacterium]
MSRQGTASSRLAAAQRWIGLTLAAIPLTLSPAAGQDVPPPTPEAPAGDAVKGAPAAFDPGQVWCAVFSPDGRTLAAASGFQQTPGQIMVWDVPTGKLRFHRAEKLGARSVAVSPDGRTVAVTLYEKVVRLLDARSGRERAVLRGHQDGVNGVVFFPDGKTLATASLDKTVRLWDVATGKPRLTLRGHPGRVLSVAMSPDGKVLASGGGDPNNAGEAKLWDAQTGKERATLLGHGNSVEYVTFSPDGKMLATASWDNTIKLWDAATGKERAALKGHTSGVMAVRFSPDGGLLASASTDNTAKLWDVATGKEKATLRHPASVWGVQFSPDGRTLATACWDRSVKLWEVATGQERATFPGYRCPAAAVLCRGGPKKAPSMSAKQLEALVADLGAADAARAYRAVWALTASGKQGVSFLQDHFQNMKDKKPAAVDRKRVARLLADLDNDDSAVREAATEALAKLGKAAEPALRKVLEGKHSAEVDLRVKLLVDKLKPSTLPEGTLLRLRAVEVLELVGSPEARQLLKKLAQDAAGTQVRLDARASLKRLARQSERRSPPTSH